MLGCLFFISVNLIIKKKKKKKKDPKCHFDVKQSFQLQGLPLTQVRECILKIFMDGNIGNGVYNKKKETTMDKKKVTDRMHSDLGLCAFP